MAVFPLLPGAWTRIIAAGGQKDQQVQVTAGRVMINFGAPDASSSPQIASTVENKLTFAPSGLEVYARALGPSAIVTTGELQTSTGGGAPGAKAAEASASGPVYTVPRLLGSTSNLALITGTNSNLTLNATTGVISATTAIAVGASQTAVVSETLGTLRVDYPVVVTGVSATPTPAPTPTPTPTPGNDNFITDASGNLFADSFDNNIAWG